MRLGLGLPHLGPFADPAHVTTVASEAEDMGYDSLWAGERVHAATEPLTPYPGGDGSMPERMRSGLDPLLTLTLAATATTRVRLGTSTVNAPLRSPIVLARGLTGIDLLSEGRLDVGLGLGWLRDEYDAVAVPWKQRGARLDETLDVLETLWADDPVQHRGRFWTISEGAFRPKPVQRPRPPIYLGGFSPAALRRVGHRADGWLGMALPPEMLERTLADLEEYVKEAGRDSVETVLRVNPDFTETSVGELAEYLHGVAELGVEDAFVDLQFTTSTVPELLEVAARCRSAFPG